MAERNNRNARSSAARRRRARKVRQMRFMVGGGLIAILLLVAVIFFIYRDYGSRVYLKSQIEAGDFTVTIEDFLKRDVKASFAREEQLSAIDGHVPGDYPITIRSGLFTYDCTLTVVDTVPPQADPKACSVEYGGTASASDFVENIQDATQVSASFTEAPDLTRIGDQTVTISLQDLGGNMILVDAPMSVVPVKALVEMEAGSPVPGPDAFLLPAAADLSDRITITTPQENINMYMVGDEKIDFHFDDYAFSTVLRLKDTIPPVIEAKESLTRAVGAAIDPRDFIASANDATHMTFRFEKEPDMQDSSAPQEVAVIAVDEGGNETRVVSSLTLVQDTEPPVISGVKDLRVVAGDTVSYMEGISVTDNMDPNVTVDVDISQVRQKEAGVYPIVYIAVDAAGNKATAEAALTVIESGSDEATVMALARGVLDEIFTDGMSDYEKLEAIYNWCRSSIRYADQPNMEDWLKAAQDGLKLHQGDCYVYCMTARALLDAAGIKNMVIDTIPLRYVHYWNLVDIGEGWYHFDTTPRAAGGVFLYMSDAEIQEYSRNHQNSHIYDHDRFPDIQ